MALRAFDERDGCEGMTPADLRAVLATDGDALSEKELRKGLKGLMSKGLVRECRSHPQRYIPTRDGWLVRLLMEGPLCGEATSG